MIEQTIKNDQVADIERKVEKNSETPNETISNHGERESVHMENLF